MDYLDIKEQLEIQKHALLKKLEDPALTPEKYEALQNSINNYNYIIELTDMNHFERGIAH